MKFNKITPVLFTEEAESCVKFWVERLGFEKTAEVPEGDKIGFAMLQKDGLDLMYQTFASAEKYDPSIVEKARKGPSFLFVEVESLDATKAAMDGVEVLTPEHHTFYGSREFAVEDPAGHVVTFAQF
jgi:uncharacterized glyoxalase superfamily protein PhnB